MSLGSRVDFFKSGLTIADLYNDGKTPETRESLMMSVMDGSTTSKQSSRRDVGMGSRLDDFGAHLVRIEGRCNVVTGSKEVNGVC